MPAKGVLKACRICIAGELGPGRDAGRVKKWVEANGGTFSSSVDEKVTHMLCSEEHFKSQKSAITKQTNKYESIKTVTFDWLEDSLTKKLKKREAPYLLAKTKETRAKKRETRQKNLLFADTPRSRITKSRSTARFEQGCAKLKEQKFKRGFQIYRDDTGFAYDITLARKDMVEKNGNGIRGQLRLYESTTQPKTYACYLTSSAPNKGSYTQAIAPEPSSHIVALDLFKKFFRVKTGVAWEKRDCDVGEDEGLEPERIIWRYLAPAETPVPNVGLQTSIEKSAPEPVNEDIEW